MKIGERGQITIPKRIRERYGLLPRSDVAFVEERGRIYVAPRRQSRTDRWGRAAGILKDKIKDVDAYVDTLRGR
jgi:AbrB family looped-hinge helix DNA binding protein